MAETRIEWADAVWNPVTGCSKMSPGCAHCYAERMSKRLKGRFGYPLDEPFRVTLHPDRLTEPEKWKKGKRIFVCSMGDLFHEEVPFEFIDQVFFTMARAHQHTFMLLTKRPGRMLEYYTSRLSGGDDYLMRIDLGSGCRLEWEPEQSNVWVGVTAENQKRANERIPVMIKVPAPVHFVSCEPLLGRMDLVKAVGEPDECDWDEVNLIDDESEPEELIEECEAECDWINYGNDLVVNPEWVEHRNWRRWRAGLAKVERCIDWVIVGCETGPGARGMELEWVGELQGVCDVGEIPFFFKQAVIGGKIVKMPVIDGKLWAQFPGDCKKSKHY